VIGWVFFTTGGVATVLLARWVWRRFLRAPWDRFVAWRNHPVPDPWLPLHDLPDQDPELSPEMREGEVAGLEIVLSLPTRRPAGRQP
jgi:hypothetical protein